MLYLNYMKKARKKMDYKFNFNKCCIWIIEYYKNNPDAPNLTLTNVVFEFSKRWYASNITKRI